MACPSDQRLSAGLACPALALMGAAQQLAPGLLAALHASDALGASEPLPPGWASSINNHCVQGCVGAKGGTRRYIARGGQGRTEQRYVLIILLLQELG